MTSLCTSWRLKSPASRLFAQPFIQAQIKENIKGPRHWPLCGGVHRWPVNSPHKWPVPRKMCPLDDVIMSRLSHCIPIDAVKLQHVLNLTSLFFYDVYCLYLHCVLDGEKNNKHIEWDGIIERYLHNYTRVLLILNGCCHRDFRWDEISHLWICDTQITTQLALTMSLGPHGLNISENYYS